MGSNMEKDNIYIIVEIYMKEIFIEGLEKVLEQWYEILKKNISEIENKI